MPGGVGTGGETPPATRFATRLILLLGRIPERLLDEGLSIPKTIQTVDCEFNVPDTPVSDLRYISGEGS